MYRSLVSAVLVSGNMTNMAPWTNLWRKEIPCIRAPRGTPRIVAGWLGKITSLEVEQVPAGIASPATPVGKPDTIVGTEEVTAMTVVDIVLVLGVPAVLALGVPINVTGVMAVARGVSTDGMFVVNPDHPPIRPKHGLTGSDPQFLKVYVYGAEVGDTGARTAVVIHGKSQQHVGFVNTFTIKQTYVALNLLDMSPLLGPHPIHRLCHTENKSIVLRPNPRKVKHPFPVPPVCGQKTVRGSIGFY